MNTIENENETDNAIKALREAMRAELLNQLAKALGEEMPEQREPVRRARVSVANVRTNARANGAKRSPDALVKLTNDLGKYIRLHNGQRIEQIAKAMGVASGELALPVKRLRAEKLIRVKGQRRATAYYWKG